MGPLILLALCWLQGIFATHFAYGTMNWVALGRNTGGQMQIKLIQNYAWRRNYATAYWGYSPTPVYNTNCPEKSDPYYNGCPLATLNIGLGFQIYPRTGPATYSGYIVNRAYDTFKVMQESRDYLALAPLSDVNWIRGFFLFDWTVPTDTQEYVVVFLSNARLSTLMDGNRDGSWLVTCNIKIYDNFFRSRSPSTTGSIREFLESCVESGFVVPRVTSDGRAIATFPSLNQCSGNPATGQFNSSTIYLPKSCLSTSLPSLLCATNPIVAKLGIDGKLTWYPKLPLASDCSGATSNTACQNLYTNNKIGCFWDQFRNVCERKDEYALQFTLLEIAPATLFTTYDVIFEVSRYCAPADTTCNHAPHFSPRFTGPYYSTPNTPFDATYHKNVCGNPNATSCLCLRGVEKVLTINAVDYDVAQTVTASSSLLPFGASLSAPSYLGQVKDPYDAQTFKSWTKYTLKWIPPLDGVDAAICFQALDSQAKPSNGNYCLSLVILEAEYIYVSGIVRDFMANHTDFARTETLADNGAQWIQSGLTDGKPTRNAVAVNTVTKFNQWFNTIPGVNQQTVFSTTLVRLGSEDRFTYGNTNFLPINGILYGNDNTQGFPGRGLINSFFTYEMHTYLAYNATTNVNYTYGSTDDMWLFINGILVPGWTLHGIHPAKYQTIDLKQMYASGNPLQFVNDTTLYRVDLFYADRSQNRTEPMIQMELPKAVLCDALSSGILEMQFVFNGTYSALAGTNLTKIGSTSQSTQGLGLLTQSQTASAVYMADNTSPAPVAKPLKVLQGFQAKFDFNILSGPTQGFAFVISSQPSVGTAGNQLGYGGMQKLIAIEFDTAYDATNGDPNYDHVTVMGPALNSTTGFASTGFTSSHQYSLGTSIYNPSYPEFGPLLNMTNGTAHSVRITYAPPQQGDTSAFKTGWLRVWMGQVIKPVVEVPIPAVFLAQMLGSAAYVGFTSGAGSEVTSKIFIRNLQIIVVPPSPTNTGVVNWVTSVVAGVVNTVLIQSRDSCGNNILVGADQARYGAQILVTSSNRQLTTEVTTSFTTNNDGTYNFIFSCTKAGTYNVILTFDGVQIVGSGAILIVSPAVTSRLQTGFMFGTLPVLPDNSLGTPSPSLYMIAVRASDGFILDRIQNSVPTTILSWLNSPSFGTGTIFGVVNIGYFTATLPALVTKFNGMGCSSFSLLATSPLSSWACVSNITGGTQAFRTLEPVDQVSRNYAKFVVVAQSDASRATGYLNVMQTSATSLIFYASNSDTTTTVSVMAVDQFGNLNTNQVDSFAISFSPVMTGGNTALVAVSGTPGYYSANMSTTSASTYTMSIVLVAQIGGGNIDDTPAALTFLAGPASYLTSTASGIGLSNSQAGLATQFSIQLIDAFGNQIRDLANALRNTVLISFVNTANPTIVINCNQTWSSGASELLISYTPLILGTYNVTLIINGNSSVFVAGRQMLVVPGAMHAPSCTYSDVSEANARSGPSAALLGASAGVQTCIYVQSRDQFGNTRNSPSDVFTFRVAGAVRNIGNNSYVGGGVYVFCFTPTFAPRLVNVVISVNNTLIGNPALNQTISVSVGSPSTTSFLPLAAITTIAGNSSALLVACFDSENNTIVTCDPSSFSFTLFSFAGIPSTLNATTGPPNYITIGALATIAGPYTIQVRVNAQQIRNSPLGMTVIPAVTDRTLFGRSTPPSGQGAFGGTQNQTASFYIQCADRFGNNQVHFNDFVVVRINNGPIINPQAVLSQKGLWLVNYTVPLTSPFNISYTINSTLSFFTTAIAGRDTDVCTLQWNSSVAYTVKAGTALTLAIPYKIGVVLVTNDSPLFYNDSVVNNTLFQVLLNSPGVPPIEFTTSVNATQLNPYQASYFGLEVVGIYSLSAFANRFVPCTPTYNVTVIPGDVDSAATQFFGVPSQCIAGRNYTFQVRLRDKFGQVIGDVQNVLGMTLVDVLGSHFLNFTSSFDAPSSNYTITFRGLIVGSYNAHVNLTSPYFLPKLGQPPFITVVPGDPFAQNTIANPPTVQTAGSSVSFFVYLYDSVGVDAASSNLCVNFDATKWNLDVKVGGVTPQSLTVTPSRIDGRFYVTYTPIVANLNVSVVISLLLNNVSVGDIPIRDPIRVNAGPPVVPPSNVTQGGQTVAGQPTNLIFSAFDVYNNPVLGASVSAYASGIDGVKFPDVIEMGNGKYNISLPGSETRRTGSYSWAIQVNSQNINITTTPLVIVPGPVDWSQLTIPSLTGVFVGGAASTIVQLKDQFGNNVTTSNTSGVKAVIQQPAVFCSILTDGTPVTLSNVSSSFSNIVIGGLSAGRLQISFIPQVRGLFRLALLLDEVEAPCQDSAIFAVSAGPVSGPASILNITTNTTADATSPKTARIVFLDAFGNNVDDFTCKFLGSVYFGNHSYGITPVVPTSSWIAPSWSINCQIESGFFVYYVTFQAPKAGSFLSVLVLQDSGVFDVISSPRPLDVIPGIAVDFAIPTDASGNVIGAVSPPRATYNAQFDLVAVDAQNNTIIQTSAHYFEIICRLAGVDGSIVYSFQPTVTSQTGAHRATFFSTWAGTFQCETKLYYTPRTYVTAKVFSLKISPAVCPQFQCADGTCVSAYSLCTPAPVCSGVLCTDGSCRATSLECPCPSGTARCAQGGYCAAAGQCAPAIGTCTNRCLTGECPTTNVPCPSLTVCPPGFIICSDALTCVLSASECPIPANCSGTLRYACAQGDCVSSFSDCPDRATCSSGTVLCFDGTCATSSSQCPSIYTCPSATPFRCSDASCVPQQADCPSQTNCPANFVLCWNDVCATSLSACDPITKCPSGTLRCSTGDCAVNIYLCPSQPSCPSSAPVLCPDGSCVNGVGQCSISFGCPPGFLTCPSGSCIQSSNVSCPTQTSCGSLTPVLCTDGSCVASADSCTTPPQCPTANPVRCPDGSCRGSVLNCPTMVVCPAERPISCPDGYCTADAAQCVPSANLTCPSPLVRCFYGECVSYLNACPPHTTCPIGYDRCTDGTCRLTCDLVIAVGQCAPGKVQCPQSNIGVSCADSLALCPPGIVCPVSTPTRCFDGSCADSVANCAQGGPSNGVPIYNSGNAIPCPDGTWSPDGLCGTPIFCPLGQFLCSNYQCLTVQTDCPVSPTCASSSSKTGSIKPLLCGTVCVVDFSFSDCTRTSTACSSNSSFRCADGMCRTDPNLCVPSATAAASRCAPLFLCRDGTCSGACPSASDVCAKLSSQFLACPDGMCADETAHCNRANGCPWDAPLRCPNSGVCTSTLNTCTEIVCPANTWQSFGFCVTDNYQGLILSNRCPVTFPVACFDGTCVTSFSECTSPTWDTPAGITPPNACPFSSPYHCPNGYCATASNMCPPIPFDYCDGSTTGKTACASGDCVTSSILCPVVRPCLATERRGVDGVCRSVDFVADYGNLVVSACRATYPYRCSNGLCAKDIASCLDPVTMCSTLEPTRCADGACVSGDGSICSSLVAEPSGCNSTVPIKCWNGECVADTSLCSTTDACPGQPTYSRCPLSKKCVADITLGCANDAVVVCAAPSFLCGSCETDANNCATTEGCPLTTPVRCASGSCSTIGNCPPTVVCDRGQVACADGSCQFALQSCPAFPACAAGTMLCSDKTCRASCAQSVCPATSPILCENGACTSNLKLCPGVVSVDLNPGTANGPDTYTPPCPDAAAPALCFDGRCRSFQGCIDFAKQVNSTGSALTSCGDPHTICSDGSCVKDFPPPTRAGVLCPIIPRCPSLTYRCKDGSCKTNCAPMSVCPSGLMRCEDGLCRSVCLAYDGCGLNAPFHCSNRNCASGPEGCTGQPSTQGVSPPASTSRRLLQANTSAPITWCSTNCISQIKAYQMTVTVDPATSPQIDLAVDASNNVVASVFLPSGSLLSTSNDAVTIEFRPVADSQMRSAENAVHPTRQKEFGAQLTYAETLLSVAFECVVPSTVVSPFALNLTYSAIIDFTRRPTTQYLSKQNSGPDVCLGYLYRIPALRYSRWTCFPDGVVARHDNAPHVLPVGVQLDNVKAFISDCGKGPVGKIYGFIHSPLRATDVEVASKEKTWAERNVLLVLIIFLAVALVLIVCVYCGFRLQRYRKKYQKEAAAVDKLQDEVDEMQQYGGTAGTKDDEVEMIPNIMVVQLQQLQETLNSQTKEEKEKELENLRLESEERRKHLETLRADRDNLAQELAQLQSDLNKQQNATVARPVIEDFSQDSVGPAASSSSEAASTLRSITPSTKTAFQSVRPTKKKDL